MAPEHIEQGDRVFSSGQWVKVRDTTVTPEAVYLHLAGLPSVQFGTGDRVFVIRRQMWESRVRDYR